LLVLVGLSAASRTFNGSSDLFSQRLGHLWAVALIGVGLIMVLGVKPNALSLLLLVVVALCKACADLTLLFVVCTGSRLRLTPSRHIQHCIFPPKRCFDSDKRDSCIVNVRASLHLGQCISRVENNFTEAIRKMGYNAIYILTHHNYATTTCTGKSTPLSKKFASNSSGFR
jgi:hypothetical protein